MKAREKEIISLAVSAVRANLEELNETNLKREIVAIEGKDNVDVTTVGTNLKVVFKDTQNIYMLNKDGSYIDTEIRLVVNYEIDKETHKIYLQPTLENIDQIDNLEEYLKVIVSANTFEENEKIFVDSYSFVGMLNGEISEPYKNSNDVVKKYFSTFTSIENIANSEGKSKEEWLIDFIRENIAMSYFIENPDGSLDGAPINNVAFKGYLAEEAGEYKFKVTYLGTTVEKTIIVGDEKNWDYELNEDGTITLTNYKGKSTTLMVPSKIDGLTVTKIGRKDVRVQSNIWDETIGYKKLNYKGSNTAIVNSTIEKIVLPEGIKDISNDAFAMTKNLKEINIPNSVTSIGGYAFYDCSSLTTINLQATSIPTTWDSNWKGNCTATVNTGVEM